MYGTPKSVVIYISMNVYCTVLFWVGRNLLDFRNTKTSVNKRLNYVMQYFLWMYYEQNMPTHISPAWSITAAKLLLFFDIHKKIGINLPIYLILCVITTKIEIAIASPSLSHPSIRLQILSSIVEQYSHLRLLVCLLRVRHTPCASTSTLLCIPVLSYL